MPHARLLLVDDEEDMLSGLKRTLERHVPELEVTTAGRPGQALRLMGEQSFDMVLLDVMMPEMNGIALLEKLLRKDPELTAVMMTAYGSIELAVEAIKKGAYDFITKPFEKDTILQVVNKGLERNRLVRENITLRRQVCQQEAFSSFVGQSQTMTNFYDRLKTVALSDYTVLVRGESGTGKELVARAIHNLSSRRNRPLIMVNCPAIPEHLLESELFGYKRGAFTGADRDAPGLFVAADGGTICLDEIADIPVSVQTKLLRVLQEHEIRPLGETKTRRVNVRIIAVTNQDLEKKIKEHTFREDLFYRLNAVTLSPPRLVEIRDDIPLLVDHFCKRVCCELGTEEKRFTLGAVAALKNRAWPGNVRQLQNVVRQALLFSVKKEVDVDDLQAMLNQDSAFPAESVPLLHVSDKQFPLYKEAKDELLQKFMNEYVMQLLQITGGNVSRAAELSGLTRAALQKILQRIGLNAENFRRPPSCG